MVYLWESWAYVLCSDWMEAWLEIKVWVWYHFLHCSHSDVILLHVHILGLSTVFPWCKQHNVMALAKHSISWLKLILCDINWEFRELSSWWTILRQLPAHRNKSRTISPVSIMSSGLTIWHILINPDLTSRNDILPVHTASLFLVRQRLLSMLKRRSIVE